jgi:hypothetical protein
MSRTLTVLVLAALLLAGCSKLTAENYAKLKVGMSYAEVTAILGSPGGCDDTAGVKSCRWGDAARNITVRFAADRAMFFSAQGIR